MERQCPKFQDEEALNQRARDRERAEAWTHYSNGVERALAEPRLPGYPVVTISSLFEKQTACLSQILVALGARNTTDLLKHMETLTHVNASLVGCLDHHMAGSEKQNQEERARQRAALTRAVYGRPRAALRLGVACHENHEDQYECIGSFYRESARGQELIAGAARGPGEDRIRQEWGHWDEAFLSMARLVRQGHDKTTLFRSGSRLLSVGQNMGLVVENALK